MILWPGTSAYYEKVSTLALSPAAAFSVLVEKIAQHPARFVDRTPIFLLGSQYFFTEPSKTEIRLQGFYVDGYTGQIEYRISDKAVKRGHKDLPEGAFQSIAVISEP